MLVVYIAHPISGDVDFNLAEIRKIVRYINLNYLDVVPFVPYYVDVITNDETNLNDRARGIKNDTELFNRQFIDEVWLCGSHISPGMQAEIELANSLKIKVVNRLWKRNSSPLTSKQDPQ